MSDLVQWIKLNPGKFTYPNPVTDGPGAGAGEFHESAVTLFRDCSVVLCCGTANLMQPSPPCVTGFVEMFLYEFGSTPYSPSATVNSYTNYKSLLGSYSSTTCVQYLRMDHIICSITAEVSYLLNFGAFSFLPRSRMC